MRTERGRARRWPSPASVAAYLLIATFFALERALRRGDEARSWQTAAGDRGTTRLLGATCGLALNAGLLLPFLRVGSLPNRFLRGGGLVLMASGLLLKAWAMRTLGRFYTRTLRAAADQPVVQSGPYRLIRHPGYLGALLIWSGFGLALANWLVAVPVTATMLFAYRRRMAAEEALLTEQLGDAYRAYQRRTWRLLPLLY